MKIANSKVLKEFAAKYVHKPFKREDLENNEPMTKEDYEFERACEQIFHTNGD